MSKRQSAEVHEPSPGKKARQLSSTEDHREKSDRFPRERCFTPPRQYQRDNGLMSLDNKAIVHRPTPSTWSTKSVPEVSCSQPVIRPTTDSILSQQQQEDELPVVRARQQYSLLSSSTEMAVPRPPAVDSPKKGSAMIQMDSRIEAKVPRPCSERCLDAERNRQPRWPKSHKRVEIDQMCQAITLGHSKTCHSISRKVAAAQSSSRDRGRTPSIDNDTSMSKDEIKERLAKHMADQWDKIAQFAECIPGFTGFSKEDQEILLQVGGLEVILLQLAQMYDHRTHLLQMWENEWLSSEQACKLTTDFNLTVFFELLFGLAESLRSMHLREDDLALFSALLLLASDHQGLRHKRQVEEVQEKVLNCFAYILAQNHLQEPGLLAQVLMCMPTLRTISTSYLELTSVSTPTQQWSNWPVEL
ncbi:nuclear receptor ROR-alpha A-like isoform X2 [Patiria miniata]|uniref:NR LBD domain-containing protein n=1 Tax=Patiria miniata TaxID=46514 RepID=A0A914BLB3_PATMI|nr:nuclear receptor ROR-alpha A-like isoform X2 [Patiria miniata]